MFAKSRTTTKALIPILALLAACAWAFPACADAPGSPVVADTGVPVRFQLPVTGPLPKTYRVTLAIVDAKNADWIVSQFASGIVCTVTAENQGRFTENWNGLDDNFMPVPPGKYGIKGIFMPAEKWAVDGQYHTVTPKFVSGCSTWMPSPDQLTTPEPFGGDPVGSPLRDVDATRDGKADFYWQYLENGKNNAVIDLTKPLGYGQFVAAYPSGGAAGGTCATTDGEAVWSYNLPGGVPYVYRADGRPFGTDHNQRANVFVPAGWVKAMACAKDPATNATFVYIAQGGRVVETKHSKWSEYHESDSDFVDCVTVHEGLGGKVLATIPVRHPMGLTARDGALYVLRQDEDGSYSVASVKLSHGLPDGAFATLFRLPSSIKPFDMERDSHGRFYVSDPAANKVYQLDGQGKVTLAIGRLDRQKSGAYDPLTLMSPEKLATWTDPTGADRILVVEQGGPNRVSEWSADGQLVREFQTLQTKANDGYAIDPAQPGDIYIAGQQNWLTRFKVNYATGVWKVDAVWPDVGSDPASPGFDHPKFVRLNDREYLACARSRNIYRHDGDRWILSAAIITKRDAAGKSQYFTWHDENGDGIVQESEYAGTPLAMPGQLLRYHGETWTDDLSELTLNWTGPDVWRLKPASFDAHGNPVFNAWDKVLTDPILAARANGTPDALHGGNELDTHLSDWGQADGSPADGYYVNSRGGYSFSANFGAQDKVSRYVPDGHGGYALKWRTGREAMKGAAQPGEIYAAIHMARPIGGVLSIIDQSRCGVVLYTEDGLYIDTLFADSQKYSPAVAGVYSLPAEFFAGVVYPNKDDGGVYIGVGKFTPMLFKASGWTTAGCPVTPLTALDRTVTLTAAQIAPPPEVAIFVRGGGTTARVARFEPALGGPNFDGSLAGWDACKPISFQADADQQVEARCMYDATALYLRWHVRLPGKSVAKALRPVERIFTHDRLADTFSFYIQGDPAAKPASSGDGRPGDARFVFGAFDDNGTVKPVELGMYATWTGPGKPNPITYRTPVGKVDFAHVGLVENAKLNLVPDSDGKGYVLVASIPAYALPSTLKLDGNLRTMVDLSATFGGHGKVWWANADGSGSRETSDEPSEARLYPGAWVPAQFGSLANGVVVKNWLLAGPFGGPGAENFSYELQGPMKEAARRFYEPATFPPDSGNVEPSRVYSGDLVSGYWGRSDVRWHSATIADMDTRVVCGPAGQVWYGAAWVYAPEQTAVSFEYQGHKQTALRYFLNGKEVLREYEFNTLLKPVSLAKGWNQIEFRGYCVGYAPFRAGLVIKGDERSLWSLKLQATPPQ